MSIRRHPVVLLALLAVAGVVAHALWQVTPVARAAPDIRAALPPITAALETGATGVVLTPLRWLLAPTFAPDASAWMAALPGAVAVVAALTLWVFRSDVAFEETAIAASAERAKKLEQFRRQQGGAHAPPRAPRRTLPLSPRGHPAVAIAWKNVLAASRSISGTFLGTMAVLLVITVAVAGYGMTYGTPRLVLSGTIMGMALLLVAGPRLVRSDIRQDLAYLALLKTYPLRGRTIVLTEVATVALLLAAVQTLLLVAGVLAALADPQIPVGAAEVAAVLLAGPPALLALQTVLATVYNGVAILFPGWVAHDPAVSSGPEVLGQTILTSLASILAVVVVLIPPSIGAVATFGVLERMNLGTTLAGSGAAAMAVAVLTVELVMIFEWLGGVLERVESLRG